MAGLHIETYGSAEPAVFVHGPGSWEPKPSGRSALADQFRDTWRRSG